MEDMKIIRDKRKTKGLLWLISVRLSKHNLTASMHPLSPRRGILSPKFFYINQGWNFEKHHKIRIIIQWLIHKMLSCFLSKRCNTSSHSYIGWHGTFCTRVTSRDDDDDIWLSPKKWRKWDSRFFLTIMMRYQRADMHILRRIAEICMK